MVGVIINVAAVLAGGTLGLLLGGRVPQRLRETIMQGLALCILLIGAQGALEAANVLAVIVCMVAGGLLGEALDIEKRLESLGALAEALLKNETLSGSEVRAVLSSESAIATA